MRIVLFVDAFPVISEGFIVDKFLGLLARGHDVHVIAQLEIPEAYPYFPKLEHPSVRARVHGWRRGRRLAANFGRVAGRLARALRVDPAGTARHAIYGLRHDPRGALGRTVFATPFLALAPDIVHFEFGALAGHRFDLARILAAPAVVSFRGFDINYYGLDDDTFYEDVWGGADGFHFLCEDLRRRALRRGLPPDAPFVIIPPAIDGESFRPDPRLVRAPGRPPAPLRIVSVGRLHWKKGYEFALDALRALLDDGIDWRYRVVGDGPFREAVEACIRDRRLGERVELLGAAGRADVQRELQNAEVFLHPAVSEGFCNAALEAQAMELPVVCTDADGLRDCVADGVSGLVVGRRDVKALFQGLRALALDPDRRVAMGRAGRERVLREFRPQDQLDAFEAFYADVLARSADTSKRRPPRRGTTDD